MKEATHIHAHPDVLNDVVDDSRGKVFVVDGQAGQNAGQTADELEAHLPRIREQLLHETDRRKREESGYFNSTQICYN